MKVSRTLFIILCFACSFTTIHAQDKYDYGVVLYRSAGLSSRYEISISTSKFETIDEGKLDEGSVQSNFVPVNKVLSDLTDKGWEVYNNSSVPASYSTYFYIRKKK